jgi:hypothetical protein
MFRGGVLLGLGLLLGDILLLRLRSLLGLRLRDRSRDRLRLLRYPLACISHRTILCSRVQIEVVTCRVGRVRTEDMSLAGAVMRVFRTTCSKNGNQVC